MKNITAHAGQKLQKLEILITEDLGRLNMLMKNQTEKALKFFYIKDTKQVVIKAPGCDETITYRFAYNGRQTVLINTNDGMHLQSSVVSNITCAKPTVVYGEMGTGKTESLRSLAQKLGRQVVVLNCSSQIDGLLLRSLLVGALRSGSWVILDEFSKVNCTPAVQGLLGFEMRKIQEELFEGKTTLSVAGIEVNIGAKGPGAMMMTLDPKMQGGLAITQNINKNTKHINIVGMGIPPSETILETLLALAGFFDWHNAALLLSQIQSFCITHLTPQLTYDFGLQGLRALIEHLGELGGVILQKPLDKVTFVKEVFKYLSQQLLQPDQALLLEYLEILAETKIDTPAPVTQQAEAQKVSLGANANQSTQPNKMLQPIAVVGNTESVPHGLLEKQLFELMQAALTPGAITVLMKQRWEDSKRQVMLLQPQMDKLQSDDKGRSQQVINFNLKLWENLIGYLDKQLCRKGVLNLAALHRKLSQILGPAGVMSMDTLVLKM